MQEYSNNVADKYGNAIAGAQVLVTKNGVNAALFSGNGVTPTTNPTTTNDLGAFRFFAANGTYVVTISSSQLTAPVVNSGVILYDPVDVGAESALRGDLATSGGSALVGFVQAGTGAVARTVQSKKRDTVSVKDFGAVGDGVADDTPALQAALNSGAARIHAPAGTYLFSTLTIPAGLTLEGDGISKTIFRTGTNLTAIRLTTSTAQHVTLRHFSLRQAASVQGDGIAGDDCYWLTTDYVHVTGFAYGLRFSKSIYHSHRRLFVEFCTYGVYYFGAAGIWNTAWFNNVLTFDTCRFTACTVIGCYVKGTEVVFINPDFSGMSTAGAIGLRVVGESAGYPAHGIKVISPYCEVTKIALSFQFAQVEIDGGGYFQGGGTAAAQATSIIDADNSTVYLTQCRDIDYWAFGYRLTNSSTLNFKKDFSSSIRAANTLDATSKVLIGDYDEGTFIATLTGCTTAPTVTAKYARVGKVVTLNIPQNNATSNTDNCTVTGLPAALWPATDQMMYCAIFDGGGEFAGLARILGANGTIFFYKTVFAGLFTTTGIKGHRTLVLTYAVL